MQRTYLDWLARAGATDDPAEVERCLDAAVAQVDDCHERRAILRGVAEIVAVPRERVVALASLTLEAATKERAIWGFRDVATVRAARRLDDAAGARAALDACVAAFLRPTTTADGAPFDPGIWAYSAPPQGYEWVLLAEGFVETLDDKIGAQTVLEHGRAMARLEANAAGLCSVAVGWAALVDREVGAALLREAEALASDDPARAWTLANAWKALGDAAAVRRVLDGALATASTVAAAVNVARAWGSHRRLEEAGQALAQAEGLAEELEDWLTVGEAAFDLGLGDAPVRRALERAEVVAAAKGAGSDRISAAYLHWLEDRDAAARVGPRGVAPTSTRRLITPPPLPGWEMSASALFDQLRAAVSADELLRIANADYGMDAAKHLAALRDICESGRVPRELAWEPHEVLALTRWSEGEGVNHVERALASLLLCLAPSSLDEFVTNGVILAESCLDLGSEAAAHGEQFFAWFAASVELEDEEEDDDEEPDSDRVFALLLLFVLRVASAPDDPRLTQLAEILASPPRRLESVSTSIAGSMREGLWHHLLASNLQTTHAPSARVLGALGR